MTDPRNAYELQIAGQVATVLLTPLAESAELEDSADIHWALGEVLDELRWNDDVRVIVLTGARDGQFLVAPPTSHYGSEAQRRRMRRMRSSWTRLQGVIRTHEALALIEKPVVARLNGDALGFGQSVMLGCDLIIARDDAVVSDLHLGMGSVARGSDGEPVGPPFAVVPGDGALAWIANTFPPQRAKEYLMLSRTFTTVQLAEMGIVNYAVPLEQLTAKTDEIVGELLSKPASVLAMTKRLINRAITPNLHESLDLSSAYEKLNFMELARNKGYQNLSLRETDE